nr:hypothetical protein [Brachybacterium halotolerans]
MSVGVNLVPRTGLSALHAEVTALSLAQQRMGGWDLGAGGASRQLVVNARPCVQCFGAVLWSGVRSLVIGADGPEVEEATGFDEGPMVADWMEQLSARGIDVTAGVRHAQALQVLRDFGASDSLVYYPRGGSSSGWLSSARRAARDERERCPSAGCTSPPAHRGPAPRP